MEQTIPPPAELSGAKILGLPARLLSFSDLRREGWQVVDVRSGAEFGCGSVPGAVNIPLFDEGERSLVGTIYRHGGREQAVETGQGLANDKLTELLAAFAPFRDRPVAVYCARGGMRSRAVVNLLAQCGYQAGQIVGGYKEYRNLTLAQLRHFRPQLIVVHGLTGTGKTRILKQLEPAIDLEELAGHRSSLFGALDRQPSSQQTFEGGLMETIARLGEEPYFIEGESRKIGRVFIPGALAQAMREGILVQVNCSLETRIARIIEDYPVAEEAVLVQIEQILRSLKQKLGAARVDEMCRLLGRGELVELVRLLLLEYYDRRYRRGMVKYRYALELSSENIEQAANRLSSFREALQTRP